MKKYLLYKLFSFTLIIVSARLSAQQPVTVTLRLNYSTVVRLYHDEPLLLTVAVTNQEAQENSRWNKAADRRLNELEELLKTNKISKEDYDKGKAALTAGKKNISSTTLGTAADPWSQLVKWKMAGINSGVEIMLPVKPLLNPSSEAVAILDERGYYVSYFGISPEEMKGLPGGTYNITATVGTESSEIAILGLKNENAPPAIAESAEMLLKAGQYYWHSNDAGKAILYADRILVKNPVSLDGLSLKGDGQVLQQSYQPALETFNKAVKEYYKQNGTGAEPPEYLLDTIGWIKKQLGQ